MRGVPGHYYFGPRWFPGGISFLLGLLILGLLVYLVMLVKRDRDQTTVASTPGDSAPSASPGILTPTEVIKMRYARGEITRNEYETMRRDLE